MLICKCLAANKTFLLLPQTHKNKKNLKEYAMTFSKRERTSERDEKRKTTKRLNGLTFFSSVKILEKGKILSGQT